MSACNTLSAGLPETPLVSVQVLNNEDEVWMDVQVGTFTRSLLTRLSTRVVVIKKQKIMVQGRRLWYRAEDYGTGLPLHLLHPCLPMLKIHSTSAVAHHHGGV